MFVKKEGKEISHRPETRKGLKKKGGGKKGKRGRVGKKGPFKGSRGPTESFGFS